jgi:hypothetical protein
MPTYLNIGQDTRLYAGLADTLIFWPDPTSVNQHRVNRIPYIFLVS